MIPLHFWDMHRQDEDEPKKRTVHAHCWLCNVAIFQDVYEPLEEDSTHIWHCEDCDVRERGPACSCGVEPANAA